MRTTWATRSRSSSYASAVGHTTIRSGRHATRRSPRTTSASTYTPPEPPVRPRVASSHTATTERSRIRSFATRSSSTGTAATSSTVNRVRGNEFRLGSVGRPMYGVEVRIADDGEVLLKGPNIFQGYYKNEDATREALEDRWLRTGDLGHLDDDGFLYI